MKAESTPRGEAPVPLVCPVCRDALAWDGAALVCPARAKPACPGAFEIRDGVPDLVIGSRFDDPTDDECLCYEEGSNEYSALHYWVPLFRRLWPAPPRPPRLLSVGCGTGVEVDVLCDAGFECLGVDNGNRARIWNRRSARRGLLLANGLHLPFADGTFDGVFCGCVFPHVGVRGDSFEVTDRYRDDRLALAREMTRVVRPGGVVVAASPNRRFPLDIFHGRAPGSYRPRLNSPRDPFLLSVGDYRRLFRAAGCRAAQALPTSGFWGFVRSRRSLKGRLLGLPVRAVFALVSTRSLRFLRPSPLAPWIAVQASK